MARRISLIITTYNAARYLVEAVDSALAQTYPNLEVIVVDDGSTDDTRAVLSPYRDRVTYIHQPNQERSVARNNGLAAATGEYVSFLDSDDVVAPEKIADLAAVLEAMPDYGVAYSGMEFFWEGGRRQGVPRPTPSGDLLPELLWHNFITASVPLFRREALAIAGGFDPRLVPVEDWELCLRVALAGFRFQFIDRRHTFCRVHESNTSANFLRMAEQSLAAITQFVGRHRAELEGRGLPWQTVLAYHRANYGKYLIAAGRPAEGRHMIIPQWRVDYPGRWKYNMLGFLSVLLPRSALVRLLEMSDRARLKRIH